MNTRPDEIAPELGRLVALCDAHARDARSASRILGAVAIELLERNLGAGGASARATSALARIRKAGGLGIAGDDADPAALCERLLRYAAPDLATQEELRSHLDLPLAAGIVGLAQAARLTRTADICTAMHLESIRGELGAFDDRLHALGRPYPGQVATAGNIRSLLAASEFTTEEARTEFGGDSGARVQDAISLRAVPQTHGAVRDALARLAVALTRGLAEPSPRKGTLELILNLVGIALIDLANISQHRSYRLLDTRMTYGLPMNLIAENPGFNHGFPLVHTAAIAILAEMKLHAPRGYAESRVRPRSGAVRSFELTCGERTLSLLDYLQKILSIEAFMSGQAMDLAQRVLPDRRFGQGTTAAFAALRERVPYVDRNRFASDDMVAAEEVVALCRLTDAAERQVGKLA
ncbi:aromatic amino acid lyase [Arthrobacter sp. NPDC058127]|uniref:aromatic amino acid lyase n=1 Tax=Arthrobacter sp. NPDC058127 TaxID=3346351 RepID=UPI0036E55E6E